MTIVERLRHRIRGVAGWQESCEAGAPVPSSGCSNLHCDSVPLVSLPRGARAGVSCLEAPGSAGSSKLAALGVLPGVRLRVIQKSPVWVLKLGRTEIALDAELARRIRVVPED